MSQSTPTQPCRLCGTNESVKLISLMEPVHAKYLAKISNLLNIVINLQDPLPKVLCHRCVIKVDDFEYFLEDARRTQDELKKIYLPSSDFYSSPKKLMSPEPFSMSYPDVESSAIQPPAIIQLNLLTCSNTNENVSYNQDIESRCQTDNKITRLDDSPSSVLMRQRQRIEFCKAVDDERGSQFNEVIMPSLGVISSRRGSRPFPKKLTTEKSSACAVTAEDTIANQVLSAEESSETKSSSVSSSPASKKKKVRKYQSPFCAPSRKSRKRLSRSKQPQRKKPKEKSSSNEENVESSEEIGPLREEDLGKYFILTKNPSVGTIYTCMGCATILTSSKAACNHSKCVNKVQIQSDDDDDQDDDESSDDESSDPEPSDNRSDNTEKETIYACQFCDKPFTRNVVRLQHERIHLLDLSDSDADYTYTSRRPRRKDYNRSMVEQFFFR